MIKIKYKRPISVIHIGSKGFFNRIQTTKEAVPSIFTIETRPKVVKKALMNLHDVHTSKNSKSIVRSILLRTKSKVKK